MDITTDTIKKLQQIEIKMLEQFIWICEKENLQYYLLGGTLLGAVRHKGFIPWDDDIDVGMPRKDFECFLVCAQKYLPKEYFLQTYKTDKEYPYPFAKIRDNCTVYKETALSNLKINHGVWIDIFPLDYCPKNFIFIYVYFRLLHQRIISRLKINKSLRQHFLHLISYLLCPNGNKATKRCEDLMRSSKKDLSLTANFCGAWGKKEFVPTEWYGEGTILRFEHLQVKGPEKYEKWLTQVYGDYMKLPPIEKRMPRHNPSEIKL